MNTTTLETGCSSPTENSTNAGEQPVHSGRRWSRFTLIVFRFVFTYLLVYNLDAFLQVASILPGIVENWVYTWRGIAPSAEGPWSNRPAMPLESIMRGVIPHLWSCVPDSWKYGEVAKQITVFPAGSGDTTYNYVEVSFYALVALIVTVLWTTLGRDRRNHERLHGFLRVYLRYVLAVAMINYGMMKVIPLQMPGPDPYRLTQSYGDSSPMGLLWAFIGASKGYSVFAGAGETLAGLLLLWRRTATLGAVVATAVLANIVALNFCYDVPVKLYSAHLFISVIFLLAPQVPRLATVLLTDSPLPAGRTKPLCSTRWMHYTWGTIKSLLVIAFMIMQTVEGIQAYYDYGGGAPPPPLYGAYTVEEHTINNLAQPSLHADDARWRDVIIGKVFGQSNGWGVFRARNMRDEPNWFQYKLDTQARTITLSGGRRTRPRGPASTQPEVYTKVTNKLKYSEPDPDHLVIEGKLWDDEVVLKLARRPLDKFLLINRGFHWINEYPMNR